MNHTTSAIAFLSTVVSLSSLGDIYWTAGSESSPKYWDDAANWNGNAGNYVIRTAEMQNAPTEVNFRTAASISSGFWIENTFDGVVTFKATSGDYGLTMSGTDMHVGGLGGTGALVIEGGTYHFANDLFVGFQNGHGRFTLKSGRAETSYWMPIGDGNGGSPRGDVVVEGGELVVGVRNGAESDNARLELGRSSGATATFLQLGGTVSAQGGNNAGERAISIGESANSTCVYTISNGTCVARSHYIGLANGNNSKGTLNIHGGTVETLGVTKGSGAGALDFDGGTLKAKGADTLIASGVAVSVGQNGCTISSDYDVSIGAAVSGSARGALVKSGTGKLAFSESVAGLVTIAGGSVVSPAGIEYDSGTFVLASGAAASLTGTTVGSPDLVVEAGTTLVIEPGCSFGAITIGEGAKVVINEDGSQSGTTHVVLSFASLSVPSGVAAADCFSVTVRGVETLWSLGETSITVSAASTTWTGAANDGNLYKTPANWSNGVPDATKEVVFNANASVQLTGNESHPFAKLVIANDASIEFYPESMDNYPSINPGAIEGAGTLELMRCGLTVTSAVTVPSTIGLRITNDGQQLAHDSWLQGAQGNVLTIDGPVTVVNYLVLYEYVAINGRLELQDGSCLAMDVFDTWRSASSTISEIYVAEGNTAICNHKGLGSNIVKTGAGTLVDNLTGYNELVMKEGTVSLASNEGPSNRFTFQGGVLRLAYAMNWFDELVNRINNSTAHTGAIRIDTALDVTLNTPLGSANTTHGFEKLGDSTLTLTSQPVYTGDTTVSAGTLKIPAGVTLPGALTIAEGAKVSVVVDPAVWMSGYTGTLFSYGSLAQGQALTSDNITVEGLLGSLELTLDIEESGVVKATVTGDQMVWNGGSAQWLADGVWNCTSSDAAATWENGLDAVFSGADIADTEARTNEVAVGEGVAAGNVFVTAPAGKGYRLTGEGLSAAMFSQSGAGSFILANESMEMTSSATVSSGELVLEGAELISPSVVNSATIRAAGSTSSKISAPVSGSGSIVVDAGATVQLVNQDLQQSVTGDGTLLVTNGWLTITSSQQLANFHGDIRLAAGGTLHESSEFNNDLKGGNVYPLGTHTTLTMAGGTLKCFYHNNNSVLSSTYYIEPGTTSYLDNSYARSGHGNNLWFYGTLTGSGNLVFTSGDRATHLYADASKYYGEITLSGGGLFEFMNAGAAGANSAWTFSTARNYDLKHGAGTTLRFGALNAPESGTSINVSKEGAIVEIGSKTNSVIQCGFTGSEFTLNKVGATSLVVQGDASAANVVVGEGGFGGTTTIKSLSVADGAGIAFADLSDINRTYEGPTVLSKPQWTKTPVVWNGRTPRGRWILNVATEEVTPEEGDAYIVWKISATFVRGGFSVRLR